MKKMIKKGILLVACIMVTIICANAQDKEKLMKESTPEQRAQMQTTFIKTKLNLDTAQTVKIQAINLKYAQKMEPVIKGDDSKFKKMRTAIGIQKDKDAELKKIFTPEQYKTYQKFEDELKDKMKAKFKM